MYRGMIFCDHSNFEIAFQRYYKELGMNSPHLDYNLLFRNIINLVPNVDFVKSMMFISKPDDEAMSDNGIRSHYEWEKKFALYSRIDVIEGDLKTNTDRREQKGVDISLAIHALSKAYLNAYDIAFVMSADSDFINLYDMLKDLGKTVYIVVVKGQGISRIIPHVDEYINLDDGFFRTCLRDS